MKSTNKLTKTERAKLLAITESATNYNEFKAAVTRITERARGTEPWAEVDLMLFNNILINEKIPAPQKFSYCNFLVQQKLYPTSKSPNLGVPSPVFLALFQRDPKTVKLLLESGADPNAKCLINYMKRNNPNVLKKRTVPLLFVAEMMGNEQCLALLLNYGADVNARDCSNISILGYLIEIKHKRLSYEELKEKTEFYCDYGYNLKLPIGPYNKPLVDYVKFFLGHSKAVQTLDEYKGLVNDWKKFTAGIKIPTVTPALAPSAKSHPRDQELR